MVQVICGEQWGLSIIQRKWMKKIPIIGPCCWIPNIVNVSRWKTVSEIPILWRRRSAKKRSCLQSSLHRLLIIRIVFLRKWMIRVWKQWMRFRRSLEICAKMRIRWRQTVVKRIWLPAKSLPICSGPVMVCIPWIRRKKMGLSWALPYRRKPRICGLTAGACLKKAFGRMQRSSRLQKPL